MSERQKPSAGYGSWVAYVRHEVLTIPNVVTTFRVGCAICILTSPKDIAFFFWLAVAGGVSDLIDGFLAKNFGWGTKFGKHYDQYADWLFGVALLYAIFEAHNRSLAFFIWPFNGILLFLIGGYLIVRVRFPKLETIEIARPKTGLQFFGAICILGGYAFDVEKSITIGYILVWSSVGLMGKSLVDYWRIYRRQKNE